MQRIDADIQGMDPYEAGFQQEALDIVDQQREDNAQRERERAEEYQRTWQEAYDSQQQAAEDAYQSIRSAVQAALQPTDVTEADFFATDQGTYEDKWDENRRRALAIAARGFEELDIHPDWAEILKIPPEVLAQGEEALKNYARNLADSIGSLERPDLINIDAAVQAVQAYVNRQAAIELTVDLVTEEAIKQGLVVGDDAKQQVAEALGVETTIGLRPTLPEGAVDDWKAEIGTVDIPVTLVSEVAAETAETSPAAALMSSFGAGFKEYLEGATWGKDIVSRLGADLKTQVEAIKTLGRQTGETFFGGLLEAIAGSKLIDHIVAEVLGDLTTQLEGTTP